MPFRRRPVLRTAAIAGGAAYAGKKHGESKANEAQRQAEQEARLAQLEAQQAQPPEQQTAAPAAGSSMDQKIEELKQLAELKDQGILTEDEFAAQKAKILGS